MKIALFLVLPLLLVEGCVDNTGTDTGTDAGAVAQNQSQQPLYNPEASGGPSISIIQPLNGAVIQGSSTIGVKVTVSGINLIDVPADKQNRPGTGHVSYILDGRIEHKSPYISDSFANVQPGQHKVRAELRNNDNTPLTPAVYKEVTVTVK